MGLIQYRATGAELGVPSLNISLVETYKKEGRAEEGLKLLNQTMAAVHRGAERNSEAELYRLKGELLLSLSAQNQAEAETCFRQAIDVARYQSARLLELRAVMSLGRLLQKRGKKEEARQKLAEIYGWFTEGFDTKDLKEAKNLLEELF